MQLSLSQAANLIGINRPTFSKAIRSEKLSASRDEDGSYSIDISERCRHREANKHRFYGNRQDTGEGLRLETGAAAPETLKETAYDNRFPFLEEGEARELAEARLENLKQLLEEIHGDRTKAERLALPASDSGRAGSQPERRGLFGWLRKAS